jgi:Calcineurin-like phosphoesterase
MGAFKGPSAGPLFSLVVGAASALALPVTACHSAPREQTAPLAAPRGTQASAGVPAPSSSTLAPDLDASFRFPAADRIVAIGDLHGDLTATRRALVLAGATDAHDRWVGDRLVVVQTGDEIDRGDDDRAIIELFDTVADAAQSRGGRVIALVGNHEAMNVAGDFRYVTRGGFAAFSDVDTSAVPGGVLQQFPVDARGRAAAFLPGGPYARRLAERPAVVVVGDTVFVHGGTTLGHVRYGIGRLNREVSRWMSGNGAPSLLAADPEGPLWTRRYSDDKAGIDCTGLEAALAALAAKRMVIGHTPHQEGVSAVCNGRVWRIDTGLSGYYGGPTEVLEIRGEHVLPLKGVSPRPAASASTAR